MVLHVITVIFLDILKVAKQHQESAGNKKDRLLGGKMKLWMKSHRFSMIVMENLTLRNIPAGRFEFLRVYKSNFSIETPIFIVY